MLREWATSFRRRENAVKKRSRILSILLAEVIALSCLWPSSTVMAQRVAAPLEKNDPELRAILTELEADAEKARVKAKIPGMSIVIGSILTSALAICQRILLARMAPITIR
jgi:hypothetical protein